MRWQAWKRGFRLALRGTGIVLLILAATVLLLWPRVELNRLPEPAEVLAKANGWSTGGKDTWAYVRDRLQQDGTPLLTLLADDDPRRHRAAADITTGTLISAQPASIDLILRLLPTVSAQRQRSMVRILSGRIRGGGSRVVSLLRSSEPLPASLRATLITELHFDFRDSSATCLLLPIARDPTVSWENRATAIEIAGRHPNAGLVAELESFAEEAPEPLARPLRLAVSRLRNTPDIERLTEDLEAARAGSPHDLLWTLAAIGAHGKAARAIAPKLVPLLRPNTLDSGPLAAAVLAHMGYREAIPDLLSAVAGTDDWLFVMSAASALVQLGATEVKPDLERLAKTSSQKDIAQTLRSAIEALEGRESFPPLNRWTFPYDFPPGNKSSGIKFQDPPPRPPPTAWQVFKQDRLVPFLEEVRVTAVRLIAPTATEVVMAFPQDEMRIHTFDLLPRHCISFAGGTLLGYNEGEWGGGVVHIPRHGPARYLFGPRVAGFIRWGPDVLVVPTFDPDLGNDLLHRVTTTSDGGVVLEPYKRISFKRWSRGPDGSLLLHGTTLHRHQGELVWGPDGHPRYVGTTRLSRDGTLTELDDDP
ncbi:MAG: HEAT repeat domain-containing protein [Opitutaceae bacterium]